MRFFILLLIPLIISSCSSQPKDCSDFKTGTFKYRDPTLSDWVVNRNDSIQTEFNKKENSTIVARVNWISDCKSTLLYKEISNNPKDIRIGMKIEVDIIRISKNTYKYRAYNHLHETRGWIIKTTSPILKIK